MKEMLYEVRYLKSSAVFEIKRRSSLDFKYRTSYNISFNFISIHVSWKPGAKSIEVLQPKVSRMWPISLRYYIFLERPILVINAKSFNNPEWLT